MQNLTFNILSTDFPSFSEVTVADTFQASTEIFHDKGLYSTLIFGEKGSEDRLSMEGHVNLHTTLIHPEVFNLIERASRFYIDILSGNKYGKFDPETKLFEPASALDGGTGFAFFMKYLNKLTLRDTGSGQRSRTINFLDKNRKRLAVDKLLVVPAAFRDYATDEDGRPAEHEINDLYRSMIHQSNLIPVGAGDDPAFDPLRYKMQLKFGEISATIDDILFGKKKEINQKVASRSIHGGTANVASGMVQSELNIDGPNFYGINDAAVGLFQTAKGTISRLPHYVKNGFMREVMPGEEADFQVVDPKTLQSKRVGYQYKLYDKYMSRAGLNSLINTLKQPQNYYAPLMIGEDYVSLYYDGPEEFMVLSDITLLPEHLDKKHVRPMNHMDFLYLNILPYYDEIFATVTRYPVLNIGGVYPAQVKMKTTVNGSLKYEIDPFGNRTGRVSPRHPNIKADIFMGVSVNPSHLDSMGLDFDGDVLGVNFVETEEAINEIRSAFKTAAYYRDVSGEIIYSVSNKYSDKMFAWTK